MTKSRYHWWGFVRGMVYRYPSLLAESQRIKAASVTPNYDAVGHGTDISKPTEQAALRELPAPDQKELDAVRKAVNLTKQLPNGDKRIEMIDLVYWKRRGNLLYVSEKLYYCFRTIVGWHGDFIHLVAKFYGLED